MTEAVRILVTGLPAEIVREIGLRLRGVAVTEFDNTQSMGRAAGQGDAQLIVLSDALPAQDAVYIARRAKDASDTVRVAYCISMDQVEAAAPALHELPVDRFFLSPVDIEELLVEVARLCRVEVLAPQASHGENIAAAIIAAWDRTRAPTFKKIDVLEDAAIAVLENNLTLDMKAVALAESQDLIELTARFGFQRGSAIAQEIAERFSSARLTPVHGVVISEQLLGLRAALEGAPHPPAEAQAARPDATLSPAELGGKSEDPAIQGAKILIVDDEPQLSRALSTLLGRRGMAVTAINNPLQFWSVIGTLEPNLVMLDLEMPKLSGTELCRAIRRDRRFSQLPVVFLTGHTDPDSVRRLFAVGADDYVGKPFVPAELVMRIENRLSGVKARRGPVDTDPVTGLATARRTAEVIERFLRLARRKSDPYAVATLEVDGYTALVEERGRPVGERILRAIGELLPKSFRGEDVVGWWGWWGSAEFIIGMYGSPKEPAGIKLTNICNKIAEQPFPTEDGQSVKVLCSAGVAQFPIDGETVDSLREAALEALKLARAAGQNRVGISGIQLTGPLTRRVDVAIVDDDAALVLLLQHAMETRNMRVATFSDGETAASALTGDVPEVRASIILLDVDLPSLNGLDVLRRLNAAEITRVSSVIMLTARTGERDVLAALKLGAIDHMAKPFSVPVLMHKVRTVLKQGQE